jgi:hypothetical protein
MEQKDIDKLLLCRKAIDDHRARKADYRATYDAVTTANKATAYTTMQDGFTASKDTYLSILLENGFESYDIFQKFDYEMCAQAIREYLPLQSRCDKCEGIKSPPCIIAFGESSCFYKPVDDEQFYKTAVYIVKQIKYISNTFTEIGTDLLKEVPNWVGKDIVLKVGDIIGFGTCPDGRGFRNLVSAPFPFDVTWR